MATKAKEANLDKTDEEVVDAAQNEFYNRSMQMGRAAVAVIDTLAQRGAFKGEELSAVGQLRDNATAVQAQAEAFLNANS